MKKIALDTGPLTGGHSFRGIGTQTRGLITGLKSIKSPGVDIDFVDFSNTNLGKYDLVHYQHFNPYLKSIPDRFPTKAIVTIDDMTPLVFPKQYPPGIRGKWRFIKQKKTLKSAAGVITISETSKKDIIRFLKYPAEKIFVTHLAPGKIYKPLPKTDLQKVAKKYNLPKKFVLFVGDVNYNKNLHTLIHACKIAKIPLVIAGKKAQEIAQGGLVGLNQIKGPMDVLRFLFNKPHPEEAHYVNMAQHFQSSRNVFVLGFVPDEDIVAVYNLASVYCQPSYYEGFGLPILEAMACGTPVVASRTNALVEIAKNAAAFVDPKDAKQLAAKISEIINNSKISNEMAKKGINVSKKYSWTKTAQKTLAIYKKLLN